MAVVCRTLVTPYFLKNNGDGTFTKDARLPAVVPYSTNGTPPVLPCVSDCLGAAIFTAELKWYDADSWTALKQAHASRPWIVHLWGMSCDPCRKEMPAWGRFVHDHPGTQVTFIEVEQAAPSEVQSALAQTGLASSDQWLSADGFDAAQRYAIDRHWGGEIPFTLLVSPDGKVETITGTMDFRRLAAWAGGQRRPSE